MIEGTEDHRMEECLKMYVHKIFSFIDIWHITPFKV